MMKNYLTNALLPYRSRSELEAMALRVLVDAKYLSPQGIMKARSIPVEHLVEIRHRIITCAVSHGGEIGSRIAAYDAENETIYIDEQLYEPGREAELREAISHEFSHHYLHRYAIEQEVLPLFSIEYWDEDLAKLTAYSEDRWERIEWQAEVFSDSILVPLALARQALQPAIRSLLCQLTRTGLEEPTEQNLIDYRSNALFAICSLAEVTPKLALRRLRAIEGWPKPKASLITTVLAGGQL